MATLPDFERSHIVTLNSESLKELSLAQDSVKDKQIEADSIALKEKKR